MMKDVITSLFLSQTLFLYSFIKTGATAINRGLLDVPETNMDSNIPISQTVYLSNVSTEGGCLEDCDCYAQGRCRPCTRFVMSQRVYECLRTGYRQWAYCSKEKINKYISCHYSIDASHVAKFWIFQILMLVIGSLSLAIVQWRQIKIDKLVAHRIEQTIRA